MIFSSTQITSSKFEAKVLFKATRWFSKDVWILPIAADFCPFIGISPKRSIVHQLKQILKHFLLHHLENAYHMSFPIAKSTFLFRIFARFHFAANVFYSFGETQKKMARRGAEKFKSVWTNTLIFCALLTFLFLKLFGKEKFEERKINALEMHEAHFL